MINNRFLLLFTFVALVSVPVFARQGSTQSPKDNVLVTPGFEKKTWAEIVHRNYTYSNADLNKANNEVRDSTMERMQGMGFRIKQMTSVSLSIGAEPPQSVIETRYFLEREPGAIR